MRHLVLLLQAYRLLRENDVQAKQLRGEITRYFATLGFDVRDDEVHGIGLFLPNAQPTSPFLGSDV